MSDAFYRVVSWSFVWLLRAALAAFVRTSVRKIRKKGKSFAYSYNAGDTSCAHQPMRFTDKI